ncbi:hypothetical protein D9M71_662470 [compost metagenome]
MVRDFAINVQIGFVFTYLWFVGQGYRADIQIEAVTSRIAEVVRLVGFNGVLVPFGCEQTLSPDGFKTFSDPTDTGEKIDEGE